MLKWNVIPMINVEKITFGMDRENIRSLMGEPIKEFRKNAFSETTTDDYGYCHVYYSIDDKCIAVEIFPQVNVVVDGKTVFPGTIDLLKSSFTDIEVVDDGCIINTHSIGVYAPNGIMESILFGEKGYYES